MIRFGSMLPLALLAVLVLVTPALAVVTVTVTDDLGTPVPGATIRLDTGETAKTDGSGTARLTTTPGTHTATVTSTETLKERTTFVVPQTGDSNVVVPVERAFPWLDQRPPYGGFGVGPIYEGRILDDLRLTREILTDKTTTGVFRTPQDRQSLLDTNRNTTFKLDVNQGGIDVPVGLPMVDFWGERLYPGLSVFIGGDDVSLRQRVRGGGSSDTALSGSGLAWGAGAEIAVRPLRQDWRGNLFKRFGYAYRGGHADLGRSPATSGATALFGGTAISESGDMDWVSHRFYGDVGYTFFNTVSPFIGVEYVYTSLGIVTDAKVNVPGFGVVRRHDLMDLRRDDVQARIGVDLRPFGAVSPFLAPLYGRAQLAFNGGSFDALLKFIYQFGGVDP